MGRSLPSAAAALMLVGALAGCSHENDGRLDREVAAPEPSYSVIPVPPRPMTGTLDAVLRQSSRDAAQNRMQVWVFNGTEEDVEPSRIRYVDPRLSRAVPAERIRSLPSGLELGYPLPLPAPRCGPVAEQPPAVVVESATGRERVDVADDIEIVQRYVDATCFERAVRAVVDLEWADTVPSDGDVGTMTLVATPTGRPGRLEILRVGATPVLKAPRTTTWSPDQLLRGDGLPQRIELPVVPARCDSHAFFEAGGATAFRLRLRLDGEVGEFVLRMSPTGAEAAIAYAIDACGLDG
jgi:hypothetical protein